jgi:galactose mutarotase-like enzyme
MSAPKTELETITLSAGTARAFLAPARGGMLTRLVLGDRPILYLDEATLLDRTKNVRGGNPVLFPSPGKLEGDRFVLDAHQGAMGQHGFARNTAWEVVDKAETFVALRLVSSDATRRVYPWDFVVTYTYSLAPDATLRIVQRFESTSPSNGPMPFGAGFHPYFYVPDAMKSAVSLATRATRAWDNAKKTAVDLLGPIDFTATEVDLHLIGHASGDGHNEAVLDLGTGGRVIVRASEAFRQWVVWTLAGKDFVCVEPWTSPANALNTRTDLVYARAGEPPVELVTEIAWSP